MYILGLGKCIIKNINVIIIGGLWAGVWNESKTENLKREFEQIILSYQTSDEYKKSIDDLIANTISFSNLITVLRRGGEILTSKLNR